MPPNLVEQVRKLTNGEGVDVAYDGVCSEESLKNSLAATKAKTGKVIVFGVMGILLQMEAGWSELRMGSSRSDCNRLSLQFMHSRPAFRRRQKSPSSTTL